MVFSRIFRVIWLLSALAVLTAFLYTYASLPEDVALTENGSASLSRDIIFYLTLAVLGMANTAAFVAGRAGAHGTEAFKVWFHGVIIFLNAYLLVSLQFVSLLNSNEKFDYGRIGTIIYGSVLVLVLWLLAWPVYALLQRSSSKEAI